MNILILEKTRNSTAIREHLLKCLPQGENNSYYMAGLCSKATQVLV